MSHVIFQSNKKNFYTIRYIYNIYIYIYIVIFFIYFINNTLPFYCQVKFYAGQIPDYVKIDNLLHMVSESSTQQILLQTRIFFKKKEIRYEENLFEVDKINKKGNYSLSFSPKFMNALIKEAKSKPKDKIDIFFQKLVIIQVCMCKVMSTIQGKRKREKFD